MLVSCRIPDVSIDPKRYPLFMAREVMNQFHKPEDKKRTSVVISADKFEEGVASEIYRAGQMLTHEALPELRAQPA